MAAAKKGGKKRGKKKRSKKGRVSSAARKKAIAQRVSMHAFAAELPDFKGGRTPVRSGCGRPRTKKR